MFGDWVTAVLAILTAQFAAWLFHLVKKPSLKLVRKILSLRVVSAERLKHFEEMEIAFRVHMQATDELIKEDQSVEGRSDGRSKLQK